MPEPHQATSWAEFTGQQAAYDSQYLLPDWHAADLIQLNPYSDTDSTTSLLLLNDFIDVQTLDRETEMYRTLRPITLQLHLNHTPTLTPYLLRQLNPIRNMRGQLMLHLDPTDLSTNPALEHLAARGISSTLELSNQEKAQLRTQYSITTVLTPPLNQRHVGRLIQPYFHDFTQLLSLPLTG